MQLLKVLRLAVINTAEGFSFINDVVFIATAK